MTDEITQDDEFFESTLQSLDQDAAPLNADAIASAVSTAGDEFSPATPSLSVQPRLEPNHKGQEPMFAFAKPLAVLAASAAVLVVAWFTSPATVTAEITLGDVLDKLQDDKGLKLQITRDGEDAEVLVAGNSVRWQDSQQQYRIANGSRLWKIDEVANTVREEDNPWLAKDGKKADLVALIGGITSRSLRSVRASKQVEHAGVLCNVFVFQSPRDTNSLTVRAFADAKSNQLYSLACWAHGTAPATAAPLAELRLVRRNIAFDESLFVVGNSLSQDGRIGKISESQGMVLLRAKANRRWTPVYGPMTVKPGDWIRTDVRGANAVSVILSSGYRLIVGPGSLLEITRRDNVLLHRGEVNITGSKNANVDLQLTAPNEQTASVTSSERVHFHIDRKDRLQQQETKPLWLAGFEGATTNESIGSLITKIDGRDVPLTVGFHKVNVEIRDQIARTTIEESFINHTRSRLEGVFYFPLPQDASISGFGMWINGELIEADVVEKQRAREIYEEILRQKKDPGLLEWAGGNIFKARVFPIEARSEKRIKIVYTQVLPMRANKYRYSYGLRSEMLQKTPLRELSLNVSVSSALTLKSVRCATHSVRSDIAKHAATLEFNAQEYTPTRDFEVVCEVDTQESDVVVVPHQRGDDGYFLAQVTPPSPVGNWQRELLPDGDPLNVLLVCDTSGSMDSNQRTQQQQFVASVLSSLGDKDSFSIAYCDVDTQWQNPSAVQPSEETTEAAMKWLEERRSLGWTDLDRMTQSVMKRIPQDSADTHVIYIGDGIVTARDADPQEFANRIRRMTKDLNTGTFHAVSVGSSFESAVLKAIAAVGGGSVRKIDGEVTPQRTAHELLNEMAQRGLRDIEIEFKGIKVAAVYPGQLPNLAAGTQQIIVGRYLPTADDRQAGEIIITGNRNGETVRYASRITLPEAEKGNSFVPRLWARAHLDHLMAQGTSQFIKDEIISLSEEFHIMTPYTSLLVLESDQQREEFGVNRRFLMRDGEKFFADGRSSANFELLQQQMKAAGNWRLGLRQDILRSLTGLGRMTELFHPQQQRSGHMHINGMVTATAAIGGGGYGGGGFTSGEKFSRIAGQLNGSLRGRNTVSRQLMIAGERDSSFPNQKRLSERMSRVDLEDFDSGNGRFMDGLDENFESSLHDDAKKERSFSKSRYKVQANVRSRRQSAEKQAWNSSAQFLRKSRSRMLLSGDRLDVINAPMLAEASSRLVSAPGSGVYHNPQQYIGWFLELFPAIQAPRAAAPEVVSRWPQETQKITDALRQSIELDDGSGLEIRSTTESFNARWDFQSAESTANIVYSPQRWISVPNSVTSHDVINWCDETIRGVASRAYRLGRTRVSTKRDLSTFDPGMRPHAKSSLSKTYSEWTPELSKDADEHTVLTLTSPAAQNQQILKLTIDTARNVVLQVESFSGKQRQYTNTYSDHVDVAGCWWPQKGETHDTKGRLTSRWRQQVRQLNVNDFAARYAEELPNEDDALLLSFPLPTIQEARIADADASADFDDYLILLLDASQIQDWDAALKFLGQLEESAAGQRGLSWIRQRVLAAARKNDEARQLLLQLARDLGNKPGTNELFLANQAISQIGNIADQNELLELLAIIKPLFGRQPEFARAEHQWKQHRVNALVQLQRVDDWMPLYLEIAAGAPWDDNLQANYARQLAAAGELEEAFAWLKQELARDVERLPYETPILRQTYADLLRQNDLTDRLIPFLADWVEEEPTDRNPYDLYLSALAMDNRMVEADALVTKWLKEFQKPARLEDHESAKLQSAVQFTLGIRYQQHSNWMDPKWREPLRDVAVYFMSHDHNMGVVAPFLGHHLYHSCQEAQEARAEAARLLKAHVGEYSAARISVLQGWTINDPSLTDFNWTAIAEVLRSRWDAEETLKNRRPFGDVLLRVYQKLSPEDLYLQFMRDRISRAEKLDDPQPADQLRKVLFDTLLTQKWTADHETEVFQLLPDIHTWQKDGGHFTPLLASLHLAVDAMMQQRINADNEKRQAEGHPEELTRRELAEKRTDFRDAARKGLVERLNSERERLNVNVPTDTMDDINKLLQRWMQIEQMHFEVLTADTSADDLFSADGTFGRVVRDCRAILGETPMVTTAPPANDVDQINFRLQLLESIRQERAFTILTNLALRRLAPEELSASVMAFIDKGIALGGADALVWKEQRLSMLVALDQPKQLEQDLRRWIGEEDYAADKQLILARILAEQGKVTEAISLMETVERKVPLSGSDYASLANWYLVVDRKNDYQQARVKVFKQIEEGQISQWISQQRQAWNSSGVQHPTELDEQVLFAFQALFEKSNAPGNYVYPLRNFYTACRDFRLLKMIPDSVVGRTPQQVYTFLSQLQNNLLQEVRNEATADAIMERLQEVRNEAKTQIDRRSLDLLEAMVERKSSEVLNEPGPHVTAAVAALKAAFTREWASGEIVQMANFLDQMGNISQRELNAERLRQLQALHAMTESGTIENVEIAWSLAHAMYFSHDQKDEGIAVIELAIRQYRDEHPGALPSRLNMQFGGHMSLLEGQRQFVQAETLLMRELEQRVNASQKFWLKQRLNQCYMDAYSRGGQVAFGSGGDLYRKLLTHLLTESESPRDTYRYQVMSHILTLFRDKQHRDSGYSDDVKKYAFEQFPKRIRPQDSNYRSQITNTANAIHELIGPRNGLAFLIERLENYPARLEHTWENGWQQFGYRMAEWRLKAGGVKDLEPRLLKIALDELRRNFIISQLGNRAMMEKRYTQFWAEKESDFARVANEVAQEHRDSGQILSRIAHYLFYKLDHHDRAIEIMLDAHERSVLIVSQQIQLVEMLHNRKRWGESIPILQPIVKTAPQQMAYRVRLLKAYNGTNRRQKRDEFLVDTETYFRDSGIWIEGNMAQLAECTVAIGLYESAVKYYDELIPLHQRNAPNQGIGNGTLSRYYQSLSRAHAHLGNTIKAVDAAAGGIVSWGPNYEQRKGATHTMRLAIISSKSRDKFIAHLDKQAEETGTDSALVRKVLGLVLADLKQQDKAVKQLQIAIELQPTDAETHNALIKSYDALKQTDKAIEQMFAQLDFDRHNLELYKQIAARLSDNEELSERAATSLVEAAPLEAAHHQALAELRQKQNRWNDAIAHWQHVAQLRALEPNGFLKLAAAQIHEEDWDEAKATVRKLTRKQWPERFRQVESEIQKLQGLIP